MPSEVRDLPGLSSSSFTSEDASFTSEKHVGFWKLDAIPDHNAIEKSVTSLPLEKLVSVECQSGRLLEHPQSFLMRDQKMNHSFDRHAVGAERDRGTRYSLNVQQPSHFADGGKINMMTTQYENSLFSSSLSELFSRKLRLSSNNSLYGHSVDIAGPHFEEVGPIESLEEIEAQAIGNLLPSDDDLFTGVTDRPDNNYQSNGGDDMEELDFFSSVGGMDLGDDGSSVQNDSGFPGVSNDQLSTGSMAGEHPYGEHPSRTLFVRNINSNVEDSELRALFEQYGDIRTLYTACKHRGFVMISYYDIRAARNAIKALQNRPLRRRKLDIHYSIPKDNLSEKDINQGTLAVLNLDSSVSNDALHQIFGVYGEIKEILETPHRNQHKFIEFYDVRAAEAALRALNKSDIAGKQIKLEPSRPGGYRRCLLQQIPPVLEQDDCGPHQQHISPSNNLPAGFTGAVPHGTVISNGMDNGNILGLHPAIRAPYLESTFHHGISSSVPNGLPSLLSVESAGNQIGLAEPSLSHGQLKYDVRGSQNFHPHSLPEHHDGLNSGVRPVNFNPNTPERIENQQLSIVGTNRQSAEFNDGVIVSAGNGSSSVPGHPYTWGDSYQPQALGMMWPNSPSFINGISMGHPTPRLHGPLRAPPPIPNPVLPINNHHVGSAPTVNHSLWDRQQTYSGESLETSGFHPGSLGSMRISNNPLHSMEFISHNIFTHGGNCMDLAIPPQNVGLQSHQLRSTMFPVRGQMIPMINSFDPPNERARSRRNEGSLNQADKKQFELDIDRILRGEDNRTTLMIKNIPNKYTSKMLLAAIDERHRGTYDFVYLPIDFKNKCNVGYAFINMIDPNHIIPFYQSFNGKKWEKFNSEKVASLAYARIQGKPALIAHFQNSSLMNEDKRCRPILFNTDGPNAGDQVPFPMGVNVRTRPGKPRNMTLEENPQASQLNLANGEDSSNGDIYSSSRKESD